MTAQLVIAFTIVMLDSLNDKNGNPIHEVNAKLTEKDVSPQVAANYIRAGVAEIKGEMPKELADLVNPSEPEKEPEPEDDNPPEQEDDPAKNTEDDNNDNTEE